MTFWEYFKNTLGWPLIQKAGPLAALMQGAARYMDDVKADILWVRRQWLPKYCEPSFLAGHGASRGVTRHRLETEAQYRSRVHRALAWQLLGGKQEGMPRILEFYGYRPTGITNLRDEDEERWAEFRPELAPFEGRGFTAEDWELLNWLVNDVKPARSKLAAIRVNSEETGDIVVGLLLVQGEQMTVLSRVVIAAEDVSLSVAGVVRVATISEVRPANPDPAVTVQNCLMGCVVRTATSQTIRS